MRESQEKGEINVTKGEGNEKRRKAYTEEMESSQKIEGEEKNSQ